MDVCRLCGVAVAEVGTPFLARANENSDKVSPETLIRQCFHPKISSIIFEINTSSGHCMEAIDSGLPQNVCECCCQNLQEIWKFTRTIVLVQIRFRTLFSGYGKVLNENDGLDFLSDLSEGKSDNALLPSTGDIEELLTSVVGHMEPELEIESPSSASIDPQISGSSLHCKETYPEQNLLRDKAVGPALKVDADLSASKSACSTHNGNYRILKSLLMGPPKNLDTPSRLTVSIFEAMRMTRAIAASLLDPGGSNGSSLAVADVVSHSEISPEVSTNRSESQGTDLPSENAIVVKKEIQGIVRLLECVVCKHTVSAFSKLTRHYKETHRSRNPVRGTCSNCGYLATNLALWRTHVREENTLCTGLETCSICGKCFSNKYRLRRHLLTHSAPKPHKCHLCVRSFYTDSELRYHKKVKHEGENDFNEKGTHICEFCGKSFSYPAALLLHVRRHSGEKPFSCSYCKKGFSHKGSLEEHEAIHTANRLFVCEVCGARFHRNACLKKHLRTHENQRPYACEMCPVAFKRRDSLTSHRKFRHADYRPFTCHFCEKTFRVRRDLTVHTRIHTGERPFTCSVCGHGCHSKSNLKKHSRKHQ